MTLTPCDFSGGKKRLPSTRNLMSLNLKQQFRSPFLIICNITILLCFVLYELVILGAGVKFINYIAQFDKLVYLELVVIIISFCYSVYAVQLPISLEVACLYNKSQIYIVRMISVLISSSVLYLIPIVYAIIGAVIQRADKLFCIYSLLYVFLRWFLIICTSDVVAMVLTVVLKRNVAYLFSAPWMVFSSYLNERIIARIIPNIYLSKKVSALISMQIPFVDAISIDYTGPRIDAFFLAKIQYVIVGIVLLFCLLWLLLSKKKSALFVVLFLSVLELISCWKWIDRFPIPYDDESKIYELEEQTQTAHISKYEGEIKIDDVFRVNCCVYIDQKEKASTKIKLDECFDIDSIQYEGMNIEYKRDGDYLILDETSYDSVSGKPINISYHGRVYYVNNIDVVDVFSSRISCALPAHFAFLPMISGDKSRKDFNFKVTAHNTIISNLNTKRIDKTTYRLYGHATTCSLFSGFLSEYSRDGIVFYRAKYNLITDYDDIYCEMKTSIGINGYNKELVSNYSKPEKVFMIYSIYGTVGLPIIYDNYVLINYGFDTE